MCVILSIMLGWLISSFVRSTTMDKWKDVELEKMKVRRVAPHITRVTSHLSYHFRLVEMLGQRSSSPLRERSGQG